MTEEDLTPADRAAMLDCIEYMRTEPDSRRGDQINAKLEEQSFFEAGDFAAYHVQNITMQLMPWQCPPSAVEGSPYDDRPRSAYEQEAIPFLKLMLEAGISKWDPDPLAAFAAKGLKAPTIERPATDNTGMLAAVEEMLAGLDKKGKRR
jgi:hypothetical protein